MGKGPIFRGGLDSNFVDLSQSRFLPSVLGDERDYVLVRSILYTELDESLNSRGSIYQTDFFAAAEDVTDFTGLTGAQSVAIFTQGSYPYDLDAVKDLQSIGIGLLTDFNKPVYEALYYGNNSYVLQSGRSLGQITRGSRQELNYAIVHEEQTYVQNQIDNLPADQRESLIRQSNEALNGPFAPAEVVAVAKQLGRDIDFGNQSDREAIGRATVDLAARTRANRENPPPPPAPPPCRIITSAGGCD